MEHSKILLAIMMPVYLVGALLVGIVSTWEGNFIGLVLSLVMLLGFGIFLWHYYEPEEEYYDMANNWGDIKYE